MQAFEAALQQRLGFLAPVGAEIFLQQIDHRPEVTAFLDVHLEQIAHVDEKWFAVVGPPSSDEEEQLDAAFEVKPTSRLSCQIKVTDAIDGLVVRTPAYQGR